MSSQTVQVTDESREEGDRCPISGCTGVMEYPPVENCYCHKAAPCANCVDNKLECPICGWREGDEIRTVGKSESNARRLFFAKLVPFTSIVGTSTYNFLTLIDYDDDRQCIEQQIALLNFWRKHSGQWARFTTGTNGHIYAVDADEVVIVSEEWLLDRSPEVTMPGK